MRKGEWFTMTIADDPKVIGDTGDIRPRDISKVADFIRLNQTVLLAFWKQDPILYTVDMRKLLISVSEA